MNAAERRAIFVRLLAEVVADAERGDEGNAAFKSMLLQEAFDQANDLYPDIVTTRITAGDA